MQKRILVVEDDIDMRQALKERLQKQFTVMEAQDGKIAREILAMSNFDLVLSDIQMPHFSGVDLADWIGQNKPTPTVLMSAFTQSKNFNNSKVSNCRFLKKPFEFADLLHLIQEFLPPSAQPLPPPQNIDDQFCRIPLENFISDKGTDVTIFVRASESKYIRVVHPGGMFTREQMLSYKKRNIESVYIKKEDFARILHFNLTLAEAARSSGKVSSAKKAALMKNTTEILLEDIYVNGVDKESFRSASQFVSSTVDLLTDQDEIVDLLNLFKNHGDFLYNHSLAVATFSFMIGKAMGLESLPILGKLVMGGLLHDVGKKEIDSELLQKARHLLKQEERHLIETHTVRGKEILESMHTIPSDVIEIAYQHHEDDLGQGFPCQLGKNYIHPLAKVVSLADVFCEYTVKNRHDTAPFSALEALKRIADSRERFDPKAFAAIFTLV